MFRDLLPLLASTGLSLGTKSKLISAYVFRIMLYGSEAWPFKEGDGVRLERNDARMFRWMRNVGPEEGLSADELRTKLKLILVY